MFPSATAALFARNEACRGILVIRIFLFSYYQCDYVVKFSSVVLRYPITNRGSDKPVCHEGAKALCGYLGSITIISTFYYGLLRSDVVSCVLTKP